MLCAAWEMYIEDVLLEGANFLTTRIASADHLPNRVKGKIAQAAKKDSRDFGVLKLCGDGWKDVYLQQVKNECAKLNTPKYGQVSELLFD